MKALPRMASALVMIIILILLPPCSAATSTLTVDISIDAGDYHDESFSVVNGTAFAWAVSLESYGSVRVYLLDDDNFALMAAGSNFTAIQGPYDITDYGDVGGAYVASEDETFHLVIVSLGPGSVDISLTLVDVPFFSTGFGEFVVLILQVIGGVFLFIVAIILILVIMGRRRRREDRSGPDAGYDLGDVSEESDAEGSVQKTSEDHYSHPDRHSSSGMERIDSFSDEPYERSRPFWRRK